MDKYIEARRLMLGDGLNAARVASRVGYYNAAHFDREHKNLFGPPPMRDVEKLRGLPEKMSDWRLIRTWMMSFNMLI